MMSKAHSSKRLESLDALRGFDMFFIMGGSGLFFALASIFPEITFWGGVAEQMHHAQWNGLTHHDTIFPLFLFIAGVSFPYSLENQMLKGMSRSAITRKILRRGFTLFLLGLLYNGLLNFEFTTLRIWSVLARIGFAWMLAALIYTYTFKRERPFKNAQTLAFVTAALLLGYWLVTIFIPAPDAGGASVFELQGNIACWLDRTLFGTHCYNACYDPEGMLSTVPAIGTALLGMLSGAWLKVEKTSLTGTHKALGLLAAGVAFATIGWLWGMVCPINKALWSSSFVCAVAGYSLLLLALFYYVIDVRGWKRWDFFFVVIGMNSITIYLLQQFVNIWHTEYMLFGGLISALPESIHSVAHHIGYILLCWTILYFFFKKKIFLKV